MRFDVTIAGELNLDLILYGVLEEIARERELRAPAWRGGNGAGALSTTRAGAAETFCDAQHRERFLREHGG